MNRKFWLLLCLFLLLPSNAIAGSAGEGGGFGSNNGSVISGVYGGSGSVYWQEIPNVDKGPHIGVSSGLKNKLSTIRNQFMVRAPAGGDYSDYNRKEMARRATNAVIDELCGGRGKSVRDRPSDSCPAWYVKRDEASSNSVQTWYKVHPLTRGMLGSVRPSEFRIVAYNFRLWRENRSNGNFRLIFERSISNPSSAEDLPSPGTQGIALGWRATTSPWWPKISAWDNDAANRAWWNGYNGVYYNNSRTGRAGAISAPTPDGSSQCQENIGGNDINGNRNAQGAVAGPNDSRVSPDTAINIYQAKKKNKLKKGDTWCYWEGSDIGANAYPGQFGKGAGGHEARGLKEAIFIKWSFDGYKVKGGKPYFRFQVQGAPGVFYIVQVAAIDSRQNLMPLKTGQNFDYKYQMIKAFMAKGDRSDIDCTATPELCAPETFSSGSPSLTVSVEEETPLQVRQESTQKVVLSESSSEPLSTYESVLPYQTSLLHYTPQLKFSAKKASNTSKETYPNDYVSYSEPFYAFGFDPNQLYQNAYIPKGSHAVQDPSDLAVQYKVSSSPAYLNIDGFNNEIISQKSYNITWYQPTLDNPCLYEGSLAANEMPFLVGPMTPSWPTNLKKCATPEQYNPPINTYPYDTYGPNSGVPIVNVWDDVLSATAAWENIWVGETQNPNISPFKVGMTSNWLRCGAGRNLRSCNRNIPGPPGNVGGKAQSTVLLAAENRNRPTVPLTLSIGTQNSTASNLRIYARENPDEVRRLNGANLSGPINLCLQGLPSGSRYIGSNGQTYNSSLNGKLGDPGCRGFAVKWEWKTDAGCKANKPTPTQIRNNNQTTINHNKYTPNSPAELYDYNLYRDNAAYGGPGAQSLKPGTVPFIGREPDTAAEINAAPRCPNREYPYKGSWVVSGNAESGWGPGNDGSRINIKNYLGADTNYGVFVVEFDLSPPNNSNDYPPDCQNIGPGISLPYCWSVWAKYQGYSNLIWYSSWLNSANDRWIPQPPGDCPQASSTDSSRCSISFSPRANFAYIKVFGARTSR